VANVRVAVAASGDTLKAPADPRFGRCRNFLIVDTESGESTSVVNPGALAGSGAGIQAAQTVSDAGAEAVIAGNYGPSASHALASGGIDAYIGEADTVAEAIEALREGRLQNQSGPTVGSHSGLPA
jgi:predicted Fe-Mo cluster-binding NifX family protein